VWVHSPGHRQKLAPGALPGRVFGFERPFGSGVVLALLDSGHVTQSQTVEFDDEMRFLAPVLLPKEPASVDAADQGEDNHDSDDEVDLRTAELPSALPPVPVATVQPPDDDSDVQVDLRTAQLHSALPPVPVAAVQPLMPTAAAMLPGELTSRPVAIQPQTWPGRSMRSTRKKQPCYRAHPAICQKQTAEKTGERQCNRGPSWLQRKHSAVRGRQKQRESQAQSLPLSHAPPQFLEVRKQTGGWTRKQKLLETIMVDRQPCMMCGTIRCDAVGYIDKYFCLCIPHRI
jgi:hypothetical protein